MVAQELKKFSYRYESMLSPTSLSNFIFVQLDTLAWITKGPKNKENNKRKNVIESDKAEFYFAGILLNENDIYNGKIVIFSNIN